MLKTCDRHESWESQWGKYSGKTWSFSLRAAAAGVLRGSRGISQRGRKISGRTVTAASQNPQFQAAASKFDFPHADCWVAIAFFCFLCFISSGRSKHLEMRTLSEKQTRSKVKVSAMSYQKQEPLSKLTTEASLHTQNYVWRRVGGSGISQYTSRHCLWVEFIIIGEGEGEEENTSHT